MERVRNMAFMPHVQNVRVEIQVTIPDNFRRVDTAPYEVGEDISTHDPWKPERLLEVGSDRWKVAALCREVSENIDLFITAVSKTNLISKGYLKEDAGRSKK